MSDLKPGWLNKQIDECKREIQQRKLSQPYSFIEYSNLLGAKQDLDEAQKKYDIALKTWDELGE